LTGVHPFAVEPGEPAGHPAIIGKQPQRPKRAFPPPPAKPPPGAQVGWRDPGAHARAREIYRFFVRKGLSPVAAAAIVGNFLVESYWSLNPKDPILERGPTRGIGQWLTNASHTGRWDQLTSWAGRRDVHSLQTQLGWTWHELHEPEFRRVLKDLRAVHSYKQLISATDEFGRSYEIATAKRVLPGQPGYNPNDYRQDPKGIQRSAWRDYEAEFALWALSRSG